MPTVRVIHWRAEEASPLLATCRQAGFTVEYLERDAMAVCRAIRNTLPAVVLIDLTRLPSHGREVAVWLRNTKTTRHIPILFVGGLPAKVKLIRDLLSDTTFCEPDNLIPPLKRLAKSKPSPELTVPIALMNRARERTTAQKMGITAGAAIAVIDPPREFPDLLGPLPDAVDFQEDESASAPLTLWFVHDRDTFLSSLRRMRATAAKSKLWLIWRKGSSADGLNQNLIRETCREIGLVDYKICSVNRYWSAMLFTRKKA